MLLKHQVEVTEVLLHKLALRVMVMKICDLALVVPQMLVKFIHFGHTCVLMLQLDIEV